MSSTLKITAGQLSDRGVKAINEDCCGLRVPPGPLLHTKGIAAIVADGVGSTSTAREASESCVLGFLNDYFSTPESWTTQNAVHRVLSALNRWLYGQGEDRAQGGLGMATTLSALILKSTTGYIFHIGDSRIYRLRDGELEQLTTDHRRRDVDKRLVLTRALGIELGIEIDFRRVDLNAGDCFLLTTDGVHDYIPHAELQAIVQSGHDDPEALAAALVESAMENGCDDNLTCQVVRIDEVPFVDDEEAFYRQLTRLPFPPSLEAGMTIDGYRIVRELHRSHRSEVFLAEDIDSGEQVALKAPSLNFVDDSGYINRFLHEEWVGRRITNPHVLSIIPPKRARRFLYFVTEHIEGRSLRQWMHDHPQPDLTTARDLLRQIARGLQAFHRLEMVHQDLKPENILIDREGTVRIIDFGSTRIAGIEEIQTPLGTDTGLLGTVNYTAPECLDGTPGQRRSDLFAFGVIAYELLTGKPPYGDEPTTRTYRRKNPTPARRYREELPKWIDAALLKAVAVTPDNRYTELSEFLHDLEQPNAELIGEGDVPLIQRNPLRFWQGLFLLSMIGNLVLLLLNSA